MTGRFPSAWGSRREKQIDPKPSLRVVDLPLAVYRAALAEASRQGLAGAIVYDAVHCFAARTGDAARIVTRNEPHFRLFSGTLEVVELIA